MLENPRNQGVLAGEVIQKTTLTDAGLPGDSVERDRQRTLIEDQPDGRVENVDSLGRSCTHLITVPSGRETSSPVRRHRRRQTVRAASRQTSANRLQRPPSLSGRGRGGSPGTKLSPSDNQLSLKLRSPNFRPPPLRRLRQP